MQFAPPIDAAYSAIDLPPIDRALPISPEYLVQCSTRLILTGYSYWRTMAQLPPGTRVSMLDEIAALRWGGDFGNEALDDPLFEDLCHGDSPAWEWTHILLRPPAGQPDFRKCREIHFGRTYYRADVVTGDSMTAEGILIPESSGQPVTEWNDTLRLPGAVGTNECRHFAHFHFDPGATETAILLRGNHYVDERKPCLDIVAMHPRSMSMRFCAHRLFRDTMERRRGDAGPGSTA